MDAQERHWIALHQANDPNHGYNAEPGGLTRPKASCVTRQRMQRSQWIRHNQDKLDERERFWIEHHKSNQHKHGYNMESGGRTNAAPHGETIEKIKAALKKSRPNDDWKAHLSAMNKGKRFISEERKQMLDLQKIETQKRLDAQKEKRMINFNGKVFLSATQRIFPQWGAHLGEKFDKRVRRKMCKSQMKSYLKNPRAIDDKGRFVSH